MGKQMPYMLHFWVISGQKWPKGQIKAIYQQTKHIKATVFTLKILETYVFFGLDVLSGARCPFFCPPCNVTVDLPSIGVGGANRLRGQVESIIFQYVKVKPLVKTILGHFK